MPIVSKSARLRQLQIANPCGSGSARAAKPQMKAMSPPKPPAPVLPDPTKLAKLEIPPSSGVTITDRETGLRAEATGRQLKQLATRLLKPAINHHQKLWGDCTRCPLHQTCTNHVLWRGYCPADVLFIGEAPGSSEDIIGKPFVGPAGRVLDDIITGVSDHVFGRPDAYTYCITNVVACFPQTNGKARKPSKEEAQACRSRLYQMICLSQPRLIITLGAVAESYTPKDITLNVFPPESDHPAWAVSPLDQSFISILRQAVTRKTVGYKQWKPRYFNIQHPAWMLRQKDVELEKKRAIFAIGDQFDESVIPF